LLPNGNFAGQTGSNAYFTNTFTWDFENYDYVVLFEFRQTVSAPSSHLRYAWFNDVTIANYSYTFMGNTEGAPSVGEENTNNLIYLDTINAGTGPMSVQHYLKLTFTRPKFSTNTITGNIDHYSNALTSGGAPIRTYKQYSATAYSSTNVTTAPFSSRLVFYNNSDVGAAIANQGYCKIMRKPRAESGGEFQSIGSTGPTGAAGAAGVAGSTGPTGPGGAAPIKVNLSYNITFATGVTTNNINFNMPTSYSLSSYRMTGKIVLSVDTQFDYPAIRFNGQGTIGSDSGQLNEQTWSKIYEYPNAANNGAASLNLDGYLSRDPIFAHFQNSANTQILLSFDIDLMNQTGTREPIMVCKGTVTYGNKLVSTAPSYRAVCFFERWSNQTSISQISINNWTTTASSIQYATLDLTVIPIPSFTSV
jgi:hypothetical protein